MRRIAVLAFTLAGFLPVPDAVRADPAPAYQAGPGIAPEGKELPVGQRLTPAGLQVELTKLRPQVLALSPDGKLLLVSGKTSELLVLDPVKGAILQRVALPSAGAKPGAPVSGNLLKPDKSAQASYAGLVFAPDGRTVYLSNVDGDVKVFDVDTAGKVTARASMPLPPAKADHRDADIPAGLAVSDDGARLYVVLNLSNRLAELDARSGALLRTFDVGAAPHDVLLAGGKAYVSNRGGRRPGAVGPTGPAGRGTRVRVDPVRHIASEGTVSVIDLAAGRTIREIPAGLHASGLALSPDGRHLAVANAGSDSITVISTRSDEVEETIPLGWNASDFYGASPNALTFDAAGRTLYVCHGTQNAIAVIDFKPGSSKLTGLIPVGWYPGAIALDAKRKALCVANVKGIGSGHDRAVSGKDGFNSHQHVGSVSIVPLPDGRALAAHTKQALENYRRAVVEAARLPPRPGTAPRPVPERAGEPSVFRHAIYIIKENRTYDQVLGDVAGGNGDPKLCIFGEEATPNQHKLVREFVLLDNTCCSGVLSADGHQWSDSAFANDYLEKSFAGFPRSYPDGMSDREVDALAYASSGFIWDAALARGRTVRTYGEFTIEEVRWKDAGRTGSPGFMDCYDDCTSGTGRIAFECRPAIESLRRHMCTNTVGWNMSVPDALRADRFIAELSEFEKTGTMPNLILICLPDDHTSGTKHGCPTPGACVADNDLAFGRIVEAVSHSRFWSNTCIFAIEDDPQGGWDHVSSYRTTAYVASPYTKRGAVISTPYTQPGLLRTIELILGLPPMNQMDAAATPMRDCFADTPDFRPFDAVPNRIPLDQMNPSTGDIKDRVQRRYAQLSERLPLAEVDRCPEDLLNRILWNAQRGRAPYPSWAVTKGAMPDLD